MPARQNLSRPFSFSPDQGWSGNAGSWSTFMIRVGTPPQDFSVLPSTSGHQPWVPVPEGCTSTDPPNCGDLRGALPFHGAPSNGFLSNESSTWEKNGIYNLAIENHLGLDGNGDFGYDTVGLQVENSGGLTLDHQVVGGIVTTDFYLGQFGLGPKPSNFTTLQDPVPGYLKNLVASNLIPSFSYAYTAGAKYRLNQVLGSLTLGGYDAARFVPNNMSIPFASDDSRLLTVGVQSISATNTLQGSVEPLPRGEYFLIDSSVPDLWLPEAACRVFEQAFSLTFDNTTNLYTVNDTIHSRLTQLNPSITLKVGPQDFDGPTVNINLPYEAFDLQANSPIYPNATNYFPIRRAANSTQYTLGRTFLQEAYIVVDYERSNFSVSQAVFRTPNPENIVTIHPLNYTSSDTASRHHQINGGAIAGIVVGAVVFFLLLIAIVIFPVRRSIRTKRNKPPLPPEMEGSNAQNGGNIGTSTVWIPELDHKAEIPRTPQELSTPPSPVRPEYERNRSSILSELPSPGIPSPGLPSPGFPSPPLP